MKYATRRKIRRYPDGGQLNDGKEYYYDDYGNLLDHKPDTTYDEAQKNNKEFSQGAVAGTTAWNPIIGAASGALQSVGQAQRAKYEEKDEYGRYKSTSDVGKGAFQGSLFDPAGGLVEDMKTGHTWEGIGGIFSPATAAFVRKDRYEKEAEKHNAEIDEALKQKQHRADVERSNNVLATYDSHGIEGASYYAMGGRIGSRPLKYWGGGIVETTGSRAIANTNSPLAAGVDEMEIPEKKQKNPGMYANGGRMVPLAKGIRLAKGDTHAEDSDGDGRTGIIINRGGKPIAEVEDNEVLVGDKVYSERLGFAAPATQIGREIGAKEKAIRNTGNIYTKNTLKREIQKNKMELGGLFAQQEASKRPAYACGGVMRYSGGGEMGDPRAKKPYDWNGAANTAGTFAQGIVPYMDNIFNTGVKRPPIPVPEEATHVPLKTTVNINPELQETDKNFKAYSLDIDQNVSNSAVGNALKGAQYANYLGAKNKLYGYKENTETGLKNAELGDIQSVQNSNKVLRNQYALMNMHRRADIQNDQSANVANATNDATQQIVDSRNYNLDNKRIELITKTNSLNNDAAIRQSWNEISQVANKDKAFKASLKGSIASRRDQASVDLWNRTYPDDPIK